MNEDVLRLAGRMGSLYKEIGINDTQISAMDKIIAATAVLTGSFIYTTDARDYPEPFFIEAIDFRKVVEYENKKVLTYLPTYFKYPQGETITSYMKQRFAIAELPKTQSLFERQPIKQLLEAPEKLKQLEPVDEG